MHTVARYRLASGHEILVRLEHRAVVALREILEREALAHEELEEKKDPSRVLRGRLRGDPTGELLLIDAAKEPMEDREVDFVVLESEDQMVEVGVVRGVRLWKGLPDAQPFSDRTPAGNVVDGRHVQQSRDLHRILAAQVRITR